MAETLNLIFSHSFEQKIWKIQSDEETNYLIIEVRSDHSLEVGFFSFNLTDLILTKLPIPETDWWTSLAAVDDGIVHLKQFESEGNPHLKKMIYWDVVNRTLVDSSVLTEFTSGDTNATRVAFYPKSNMYFETLKNFIEKMVGHKAVDAAIEYLEIKNFVMISYYFMQESMANYLLVVNQNKSIILHECLAKDLKGIGQETFSVKDNNLIFVKNKQELYIYQFD